MIPQGQMNLRKPLGSFELIQQLIYYGEQVLVLYLLTSIRNPLEDKNIFLPLFSLSLFFFKTRFFLEFQGMFSRKKASRKLLSVVPRQRTFMMVMLSSRRPNFCLTRSIPQRVRCIGSPDVV